MWVIASNDGCGGKAYFRNFGLWHIPEFSYKLEEVMKFRTKKEAQTFAKTNSLNRISFEKI